MKKVIFGIVCLFMVTCFVNARTITSNELIEGFANDEYIAFANQNEDDANKIRILINNDNNKLYVSSGEQIFLTMNYTEDYLEYINNNPITVSEAENQFAEMILMNKIAEVIFKISGYQNYTLKDDIPTTLDYATYGLEIDSEEYSFTQDGATSSGDFIKKFKISLDTEKIAALMTAYGEEQEPIDNSHLIPTVTVKKTEKNKITLNIAITSLGENEYYMCDIYRAESEDGEFTQINESHLAVGGSPLKYVDSNVTEGKTYYYKAKLYSPYDISSTVVSAKAVTVNTNTNTNTNDKVTNPKTGVNQFIPLLIFFVAGCGCLYLFHKNEMEL